MDSLPWTTEGILSGLYALVAVMLIIVLYHVLFIVVDVRKVMRRVEKVSEEVQTIIMKPLAMTDQILEWIQHTVKKHDKKAEFKKREL